MSSACPIVAHSLPHINYVRVMCEQLLNITVYRDCEQCPIALNTTVLQNHTQCNHNQILIESKFCKKRNQTVISAPHVVLDKTCASTLQGSDVWNE